MGLCWILLLPKMILYSKYKKLILLLSCLAVTGCAANSSLTQKHSEESLKKAQTKAFFQWLHNYKQEAKVSLTISNKDIEHIFSTTHYNYTVHKRDKSQAEFLATLQHYYEIVLPPQTYKLGTNFLNTNLENLLQVEKKYKIPASLIVALIGIETRYNPKAPTFNAAEALANLAFNPRRRTFFTNELNCLLQLMKKNYVSKDVKASWAGALGYPQFMPSTYLAYGLDGNGDGKVDLYNSLEDVFASVANFLRKLGWNYYRDWGYEVILPNGLDKTLINNDTEGGKKPLYEWQALGVKKADGTPFDNISALARVIVVPYTKETSKTFLVTSNFEVIMKWNKSVLFALAVGKLKDYMSALPDYARERSKLLEKLSSSLTATPAENLSPVKKNPEDQKQDLNNIPPRTNLTSPAEQSVVAVESQIKHPTTIFFKSANVSQVGYGGQLTKRQNIELDPQARDLFDVACFLKPFFTNNEPGVSNNAASLLLLHHQIKSSASAVTTPKHSRHSLEQDKIIKSNDKNISKLIATGTAAGVVVISNKLKHIISSSHHEGTQVDNKKLVAASPVASDAQANAKKSSAHLDKVYKKPTDSKSLLSGAKEQRAKRKVKEKNVNIVASKQRSHKKSKLLPLAEKSSSRDSAGLREGTKLSGTKRFLNTKKSKPSLTALPIHRQSIQALKKKHAPKNQDNKRVSLQKKALTSERKISTKVSLHRVLSNKLAVKPLGTKKKTGLVGAKVNNCVQKKSNYHHSLAEKPRAHTLKKHPSFPL